LFIGQRRHAVSAGSSVSIFQPAEAVSTSASRAALTGRSLQEYLRAKLMELARQPVAEVLIARVRARKAASASTLSRDRILAHRDEDRR
jgi:antitoxin FitA